MGDFFELQTVTKTFGAYQAVNNATIIIKKGEVFSLLGPSGCGKTTLLRIAAGFEQPDQGRVILDGRDITALPPNERQINTVFQNYALFPHLTVWDNIAFGLKIAGRSRQFIKAEVERMLDLIDLGEHAYKKPAMISGGQKQRVAIARALINKPQVLLLDEPLGALDLKLRQRMLLELDRIHDEVGISFLYVTHDQGEAMSLSDRIAVMNRGRIEQTGAPVEIYEAPKSSFVAAFIGDTNFLESGKVVEQFPDGYCRLQLDGFPKVICYNDNNHAVGEPVVISVRPEKLRVSFDEPADRQYHNKVRGQVEDIIYFGSETKYFVRVQDYRLSVFQQNIHFLLEERQIKWNDEVWISWHGNDSYMLQRYTPEDERLLAVPDPMI
ncbi:MAG: ABC transporter ATP-binding protein [Verrucomicrobiales bacterium]|jgi:spermidine/putrescine transport system ATP-binding protein|nr:ABC transporter ATP-binding protein [Verrucomicrobiales bacterium]